MDSSGRHAYLIIAHSSPYVLEKLIVLLDDVRNDIYIHIDKKVEHFDFAYFQALPKKSTLQFIERMDVRWGHVSLVAVELNLMRAAYQAGVYSYYHLISGADLPLKSQNEIHTFFDKNAGKEFVGFGDDVFDEDRVTKMHIFPKYMRVDSTKLCQRGLRFLRNKALSVQRAVNCKFRKVEGKQYVYGSQWASMTGGLVGVLLEHEKEFLHFYKYSNCSDEIYKQSFVYNSEFFRNVYDQKDELKGCQRFMDWKRGRPYTFREEDFNLVINSGMLFARKFDENTDKKIVDLIFDHVQSQQ